ncbi:MAG: UDP-N-acetylmuramoyl-L-alanyl-D-glutamate--LD-lysine ligase [Microgenomates bacterium OLB22]|nr:MAG: UDP-N-acetylmuramoyl-L-alanyl-D-glutamate--LD-lysine ligase [Microgenomates bacterium OLB22]
MPLIFKKLYHRLEAYLAMLYFRFPYKSIKVIGVTGTDGKTTTAHLIHHILISAGVKTSMISTIHASIGGIEYPTGFHVTTPRAWNVYKYLRAAADAGSTHFVMETTSHGIEQDRVRGIRFTVGVITNVTHEHLFHHGTFDRYVWLKTQLLAWSEQALLNKEMAVYDKIARLLTSYGKHWKTYAVKDKADYMWQTDMKTQLPGAYNKENCMAAYSVTRELGIPHEAIVAAIATYSLPKGRYDIIQEKPFTVIIDFAHTPHSIDMVLKATKEGYPKAKKVIHVFGAASQRDDEKRPLMGKASGSWATTVILTEEDYRNESFEGICEMIGRGLQEKGFVYIPEEKFEGKKQTYTMIKNRKDALEKALKLASKDDVVIATGKGHESSLNRDGVEHEWDEQAVIKKLIKG